MKRTGYALVTGGSEGIGFSIANALAARGYSLLLVALPDSKLTTSAEQIRKEYGVQVFVKGIDLTEDGADLEIHRWVTEEDYPVEALVNNAGFGQLGPFEGYDRDFYHRMIHVNLVNVVGLTRLMLDQLKLSERGYVLNVGSIASFFPMPYKTVYASTKYFIYSFSRALREEMRYHGVSVSLLCPGAVLTNASVKARIDNAGYVAKLITLTPEYVGRLAVTGLLRGKWLIMPGFSAKLAYQIKRVVPCHIMQRMLARKFGNHGRPVQI